MSSNRTSDLPFVGGAGVGIVTWIVGYVLTYLVVAPDIRDSSINRLVEAFGGAPATYEMVGWVFFNAHFVDVDAPSLIGGAGSANLISQADGGSLSLLFVLPPLLLIVAGVVAGRAADASDPDGGARAGAFVLAGYLPLAVVGAFLFRYTVGDGSVAPTLVTAVLLAGVVYPVVFGAIGGAVSSLLRD